MGVLCEIKGISVQIYILPLSGELSISLWQSYSWTWYGRHGNVDSHEVLTVEIARTCRWTTVGVCWSDWGRPIPEVDQRTKTFCPFAFSMTDSNITRVLNTILHHWVWTVCLRLECWETECQHCYSVPIFSINVWLYIFVQQSKCINKKLILSRHKGPSNGLCVSCVHERSPYERPFL